MKKDEQAAPVYIRTLAKEMTIAGEKKSPGDEVALRQDQIDRLEPEGYFEPEKKNGGKS